jgi:hypothetical protein
VEECKSPKPRPPLGWKAYHRAWIMSTQHHGKAVFNSDAADSPCLWVLCCAPWEWKCPVFTSNASPSSCVSPQGSCLRSHWRSLDLGWSQPLRPSRWLAPSLASHCPLLTWVWAGFASPQGRLWSG